MAEKCSTPPNQSIRSSDSEQTPDSETLRTRRAYTKSPKSPSLQAFYSFIKALGQLLNFALAKIDHIGVDDVNTMKSVLEVLDTKCENMKKEFQNNISSLDRAINSYEKKKPTDFATDANNVSAPEEPVRYHSSLAKGNQTIGDLFAILNQGIVEIFVAIQNKIDTSIYENYSFSMENKLKRLKEMCEQIIIDLEKIGKNIKDGIGQNEDIRRSKNN